MTRANSASGIGPSRPTMRLAGPMPAQLIRMRAGPWSAAALANAASVAALSVTSQASGDAVDLGRDRRRRPSALTSKIATLAPAAASMRAVAAPRPEAPPVTIAACPMNVHHQLASFDELPLAGRILETPATMTFAGGDLGVKLFDQ